MHELSLISNLLKKVQTLAKEQNAKKIICVSVRLGALAHISPEHFREHFDIGTKNTSVEGADLKIEVSDNINDPNAQEIVLDSIEVE